MPKSEPGAVATGFFKCGTRSAEFETRRYESVPPTPLLPEEGWPRLCEAGVVGADPVVNRPHGRGENTTPEIFSAALGGA